MPEETMRIRSYRPEDASRLEDIFRRAVREIGSGFYSPEQVTAWSGPRVTAETLHRLYTDGRATFIAADDAGRAIAFTDLGADGHVDMLYCDPDFAGRGIARALLAWLETAAREKAISRLHTESSEAARPVFEKAGFVTLHRRDIEIDGVAIHNWAMEKRLA